ncbi:hypothetical protein GQ55_9G061200 [Panicum hallii var. hallii]|uniref:Uncharacterized protein n=1 Tax=Panicum hallii var. hallii TaxID=1504633 RepID=A0A2T7C066_9POAL|nr:hypothetical protein GQ55_9G061200 [Panicum hallii var. hallii]
MRKEPLGLGERGIGVTSLLSKPACIHRQLSAYISLFRCCHGRRLATASSVSSGKIEHAWHGIVAWIDVGDGRCTYIVHALRSSSSSSRSERGEKLGDMPGSLYATRVAASQASRAPPG